MEEKSFSTLVTKSSFSNQHFFFNFSFQMNEKKTNLVSFFQRLNFDPEKKEKRFYTPTTTLGKESSKK